MPCYHQAKLLKIHERALCGEYKLRCSDLLGCAKAPWERAFNLENTLKAWEKTGLSPFTRSVYWDLKAKEEERAAVAAVAEVNPELLTVHGMVRCMFPKAAAAADAETEREAAESAQGPGKTKKRKDPDARLNSSHLWHLPGGATGDECLAIVKEKTEARKAKELKTKEGKEKRAKAKKDRLSAANSLGSWVQPPMSRSAHADNCRHLVTLADTFGVLLCGERVWGRPPGYVTLWDPKEHFSEENSSPGGPGATPHYAYLTYPHLYIGLTLV